MADESGKKLEPQKVQSEDAGAHDLESSDSEDHFSDAQTGFSPSQPIPTTRIEKVDDEPSHGEVLGTEAHELRSADAKPDEIAIVPEDEDSVIPNADAAPTTPHGGRPIPLMVVEKIDPSSPSHGEVPGTEAHEIRKADAVPDVVLRAPESGRSTPLAQSRSRAGSTPGDLPIPTTKVEKVDSSPSHGEVPGTEAYEKRKEDAEPDEVEEVGDITETPTSNRSAALRAHRRKSSAAQKAAALEYDEAEDGDDNANFGDDFDDFEDGEEADFGDFDDGFQESEAVPAPSIQSLPTTSSAFPVLDLDDLVTPGEILAATEPYLAALYPDSISPTTLPTPVPSHPIFLTDRSASLWSQLVAPPPLQPPDWIRSRIRRLFLVSLGVPVDLDEILPASKQKKLILPSMLPSSSSTRTSSSITRLKSSAADGNASTTSIDSHGKPRPSSRRRGPPPAPELDLLAARQLCNITDAALEGLTDAELRTHVRELEALQATAGEVLEYWTKMTDGKLGDREAFEGVIENLVQHARKVRK